MTWSPNQTGTTKISAPTKKDDPHIKPVTGEDLGDDKRALDTREQPMEERRDSLSTPNRTYYGVTQTLGASQTDSVWQIWAEDESTFFHRRWADNTRDFDKKWSDRTTYFPAVAFANQYSIQFSGASDDYFLGPDSSDYNFANTDEFSMAFWVKTTNQTNMDILSKTSGDNNGYRLIIDSSGRIDFIFRGNGSGDQVRVRTDSIANPINGGDWRFVAVTKASGSALASTLSIYTGNEGTLTNQTLNIIRDSLTGSTQSSTQLGVGAKNDGTERFIGNIDEPAIWNVELSQSQIETLYNSNNGIIDISNASGTISSGLVSWWRMGDGSFVLLPTIPDEISTNDLTSQGGFVSGDIETEVAP